jgi:hypothetical protein
VLYPQLLERDFERLPRALREFHSRPGGGRATGRVAVRHASSLVARLVGFPPCGDNISMQLEVVASENKEVWIRRFGDRVLKSVQRQEGRLLEEAIGPVRVLFRVLADESGLRFESQGAHLWRMRLPLRVEAQARGDESSWELEVTVAHVGSYRGAMIPMP